MSSKSVPVIFAIESSMEGKGKKLFHRRYMTIVWLCDPWPCTFHTHSELPGYSRTRPFHVVSTLPLVEIQMTPALQRLDRVLSRETHRLPGPTGNINYVVKCCPSNTIYSAVLHYSKAENLNVTHIKNPSLATGLLGCGLELTIKLSAWNMLSLWKHEIYGK